MNQYDATKSQDKKVVLFFLSPRPIDFDTYLPTAMELKSKHDELDIKFITFSLFNYNFINKSDFFRKALRSCGGLYHLGADKTENILGKAISKIKALTLISFWIVKHKKPVLFLGRPFSKFPYNIFYSLAKLRGGNGFLLSKTCSPEEVYKFTGKNRSKPEVIEPSVLNKLIGKDLDGLIHYHRHQTGALKEIRVYGRIFDVPWLPIGMPHKFNGWRQFVDKCIEEEKALLESDGVTSDTEIYCTFAPKQFSSVHLRSEESISENFFRIAETLLRLRPNAILLVKVHPLALDEEYIKNTIKRLGEKRIFITMIHPEILIAMSRCTFFINPTTIMFNCFKGNKLDISDYPESHYEEEGDVSLANGLGVSFINPVSIDFESRLSNLLNSDEITNSDADSKRITQIMKETPPDINPLVDWVINGHEPKVNNPGMEII